MPTDSRHIFSVGVVSDEASPELDGLLAFLTRHKLDHVELNFVEGASICDHDRRVRERVRAGLQTLGIRVSAIGSRAFRGELDDDARFMSDLDHLDRATDAARYFDTRVVRIFSFARLPRSSRDVAERLSARLHRATDLARRTGVTLVCENTGSGNLATTEEVCAFFASGERPDLRLLWDPANAVGAGDPLPVTVAFDRLRRWVEQIHVKNVTLRGGDRVWTPVASGEVDYPALLRALARQSGPWCLTLDTHFRLPGDNGQASTKRCLGELRQMLRAADARASTRGSSPS